MDRATKRTVRREVWLCHHCGSWWPNRAWPLAWYLTDEAADQHAWPVCPRCTDDQYPLDPIVLTRRRGVQSPHLRGWTYTRVDFWPRYSLLYRSEPLRRYPT